MNPRFQSRVTPTRKAMPAACVGAEKRGCGQGQALSAFTLAQAADMALRVGISLDWKREFISHLQLAGASIFFKGVFVGVFTTVWH